MVRVPASLATQKSYDEWYAGMLSHVPTKHSSCQLSENSMNHGLKTLIHSRATIVLILHFTLLLVSVSEGDRKRKSITLH